MINNKIILDEGNEEGEIINKLKKKEKLEKNKNESNKVSYTKKIENRFNKVKTRNNSGEKIKAKINDNNSQKIEMRKEKMEKIMNIKDDKINKIKDSSEKYKAKANEHGNSKCSKIPSISNKKDNNYISKNNESEKIVKNNENKHSIIYKDKTLNNNELMLNKKRKRDEKVKLKISSNKKKIIVEESIPDDNKKISSLHQEIPDKKEHIKKIIKNKKKEIRSSSKQKCVILKPKGTLVYELLERWWYALPDWPPNNYDDTQKLIENRLRLVKINDWRREPKYKDNLEKCMELPGFKYVYLNSEGKVFDFRPEEGKPSYNNLIKLSEVKLSEYLVIAYKGQLEELEKRNSILEKDLRNIIKEKLDRAERNLAKFNE